MCYAHGEGFGLLSTRFGEAWFVVSVFGDANVYLLSIDYPPPSFCRCWISVVHTNINVVLHRVVKNFSSDARKATNNGSMA